MSDKKTRHFLFLLILATLAIVVPGCVTKYPTVTVQVKVTNITPDEIAEIKNTDAAADDFKKLYVMIRIDESKRMKERHITVPNLVYQVDHYDRIRSASAGSFEQNNVGQEDFAVSEHYVIFDARGLDERAIREMVQGSFAHAGWTTPDGKKSEDKISIENLLLIE
ncbi:hypothetical protein [Brevibacillus massiliensis]|jgi:hypothetical protein|uniref:hypothetical protein n=1 Tax=Brevibacillus massiliensis TaxID=1118054 RepID=UPI0002FBDEEC|nr:hypothetical protein [Brevibacillus massiliensis]